MTTCECEHCLTCHDYNHPSVQEQRHDYWGTTTGIKRRMRSLAQDFTYKIVNNALKIYGQTNDAKWLRWYIVGDDRVCPICVKNSQGGDNGYYKPNWFLPEMPAHPNCFLEGTLVDTLRGLIPIQYVRIGDYVLTHKNRYRQVRQTHKKLCNGKIVKLSGVWMTANHRVLTTEGWRRADSIKYGDKTIISTLYFNNENIKVNSQYLTPTVDNIDNDIFNGYTYNLTVHEDESYAVGVDRLLVHNCRCQWIVYYKSK